MNSTSVDPVIQLDGIPLWLLILMSSLALLGIIYATGIIIFNLSKAKNKVIKMTSPNINILILTGAICGYCCMVLLGLDSGLVGEDTMEALHRASTFILTIGSTLIYGAMFAKCWRVFLVFKNINFNGKLTRDEHLLVGILVMVAVDLVILLPWQFADPIECTRRVVKLTYNIESGEELQYEVDDCQSSLQGLWVGLIYFYKLLLILAGLYFTWQTRNVTLPSLKDCNAIYLVIYTAVVMALVALPTIVITEVGMKIRYTAGALILWIVLTVTISLLFVPKIILERKSREAGGNISAFNFLFSESMRKTQEAVRKCSLCFCCTAEESDRYAQEMLASEIETLKRTIKQKDDTIRELNDRLYIGTEKFHEYLVNPKSNRTVLKVLQDRYEAKKSKSNGVVVMNESRNEHLSRTELQRQHPTQKIYEFDDDRYEDEGVHSSDSHFPNNHSDFANNHSDFTNNHSEFTNNPNQFSNNHSNLANNHQHDLPYQHVANTNNHSGFPTNHNHFSNNHTHLANNHQHDLPHQPVRNDSYYPFSQQQQQNLPVQTVSNGYLSQSLPRRERLTSTKPTQGNFGSLHSLHSHNGKHSAMADWRPPSPNHDSAFDDHTPSSDGNDKYPAELKPQSQQHYVCNTLPSEVVHHHRTRPQSSTGIAQSRQFSQIDLGAMEYDALKNFQRNPSLDNRYHGTVDRKEGGHHYGSRTAVSQI